MLSSGRLRVCLGRGHGEVLQEFELSLILEGAVSADPVFGALAEILLREGVKDALSIEVAHTLGAFGCLNLRGEVIFVSGL